MRHPSIKYPFQLARWGTAGLLMAAGVSFAGCDDLIEPDISSQQVALVSPADNNRSTILVQSFQWQAVPNARTYRLQLATPSFAAATRLTLDSVVRQPSLSKSLRPGRYEWRVQASNAGYETAFTSRTLFLDSTGSLVNQLVQLNTPSNGFLTNAATITLGWDKLPMAQQYRLYVAPNPRGTALAPLDSAVGTSATVTLRFARQSRAYQWRVTALNATAQVVSPSRTFEVDVTPPPVPTLVAPVSAASFLTQPIALSWTRGAPDVTQDSLFVYRADQTTLLTGFPRLTTTAGLTLAGNSTPLVTGTYYWAVRSLDRAGNRGPMSAKRPFILQ